MLDQMTCGHFEPLLNQRFVIHVGAEKTVELVLFQVQALPAYAGLGGQLPKRPPFSLLFRGPPEFVLPQGIFEVEQESLGKLGIFLVPIGPDEVGQRYQAVFN